MGVWRGRRPVGARRQMGMQSTGTRAGLNCCRAEHQESSRHRPPVLPLQLDWRLAGNRAPLGLFFHAGV